MHSPAQLPHENVPVPHPLSTPPQTLDPHATACVFGVQPQTLATLGVAPPQVIGVVHPPQSCAPHSSLNVPHFPEHFAAEAAAVQPHVFAVPPPAQVCAPVHALVPQSCVPPQLS